MKTIVIAGAKSHVGKTSLAIELQGILPQARYVKIGTSPAKQGGVPLYPPGTQFERIAGESLGAEVLIIESNAILREFTPDVCFFLEGSPQKPSADLARTKADVVSGVPVAGSRIDSIASKLNLSRAVARRIVWLAGARPEPAAAVILIGGRSSRMGVDKAFITIDGIPAAERLYKKLIPHFDEVFFSAAPSQPSPVPGVRCVYDYVADKGPLAGLATALSSSPYRSNFVIACDIPEIDIPLMRKLLSLLTEYEIAVPAFTSQRTEPLFGAYNRSVGETAKRLLDEGISKVLSLFSLHKTGVIAAADTGWYANLNTPDDLDRYTSSSGKKKTGGDKKKQCWQHAGT